jgi:hypothetical protein
VLLAMAVLRVKPGKNLFGDAKPRIKFGGLASQNIRIFKVKEFLF